MDIKDLTGEWFSGSFQEYLWRCYCEEVIDRRCDGTPRMLYLVLLESRDSVSQSLEFTCRRTYYGDHIKDIMVDFGRTFKSTVFLSLFNDFVREYLRSKS